MIFIYSCCMCFEFAKLENSHTFFATFLVRIFVDDILKMDRDHRSFNVIRRWFFSNFTKIFFS